MDRLPPCRSSWTAANTHLQGCFLISFMCETFFVGYFCDEMCLLTLEFGECRRVEGFLVVLKQLLILETLQVYVDGTTTMSTHERKASIREFYGTFKYSGYLMLFLTQVAFSFCNLTEAKFLILAAVIYPSLLQLQRGITDTEDKKQKAVYMESYRRRDDEEHRQYTDADIEREEECGICMETNSKIVLPNCNHAMCLKCYREWYFLSSSFPLSSLYM